MVKFKYYHTGSTFNSANLSNDDIAFVEETGAIWTHGHEYKPPVTSVAGKTGAVTLNKIDVGLSNVDNTADANKEVKATKAVWPIAYLENNGVGMTVAQVKTWIATQFNTNHVSVGDYVFVSKNVIENWDDDSHVVTASSTYSFIKIAGGYTDGNINQWMIAGYGNNNIGYVGRTYDEDTSAYAWTPIKWIADTNSVGKWLNPLATIPDNGVGMTVAQVKAWIVSQFSEYRYGVGDYVSVSSDAVWNWADDSHVVVSGNSYSFTRISGGYAGSSYGTWLLAEYGTNRVGIVGRDYYQWTPIKWFADLSDVEGFVPKRANNMFYPFVGASPTRGNIFKVTMPSFPDTEDFWYMVTFELVLCGSYNNAPDGRIYTTYYFRRANGTISADVMRAVGVGSNIYNNSVSIKYDIQSPNVFYVDLGTEGYQTLAIENLSALDSATNFDFSYTTIETVHSIPSAASSTVPIDILDIARGGELNFNGQPVVLNNDGRLSDSRAARNQKADYTTISSNTSNVTTSLTEDGSETKVYYNSGNSAVTVSFATSGLTFVDGNDSMEISAGGYGEVNFLRVTTSGTTRVFVRSIVSE